MHEIAFDSHFHDMLVVVVVFFCMHIVCLSRPEMSCIDFCCFHIQSFIAFLMILIIFLSS